MKTQNPGRRTILKGIGMGLPSLAAASLGGYSATKPMQAKAATDTGNTELSAVQAVQRIRNGDMKAEDYVSQLIARNKLHQSLNAYTYTNYAQALEQARAVDVARSQGKPLGTLAGLPLVVKDNIDTMGFPSTAGTRGLKENNPTRNAPVVDKLYAQGALLLGKTNMHELALGGTSSNAAFGFVKNPHDTRRVPGGSSGGTAAAIAARLAPAGLGTDTAGSVRIPSSFCGLAGLRPTTAGGHTYPVDGVVPLEFELDTIGPLARSVSDVALLDSVITGRPLPQPASLKGMRIGVPRAMYWEDLGPGVQSTLEQAMARLKEQGVVFVDVDLNGLEKRARDLFFAMNASGFGRDLATYLAKRGSHITLDQVKQQIASNDVKTRFESPAPAPADTVMAKLRSEALPAMTREYQAVFKQYGIQALAYPTEPIVAPLILEGGDRVDAMIELNGRQVNEGVQLIRNTPGAGAMGFPGLNLPAGLSPDGMPVGLELDGLGHTDSALLAIGMAMEKALGPLPAPQLSA
jgi:mandelamide amidase